MKNENLTFNGITRTFHEWDDHLKFPRGTVKRRKIVNKWTNERCLKASLGNHASAGRQGSKNSPWRFGGGSDFKAAAHA